MKLGRRTMIPVALLAALAAVLMYFGLESTRAARHAALPDYDVPRLELRPGRDAPFAIVAAPASPGRARALEGAREVRLVIGVAADFKRYEDALATARAGTSTAQVRVLVVPIVRVAI